MVFMAAPVPGKVPVPAQTSNLSKPTDPIPQEILQFREKNTGFPFLSIYL